MAYAQDLIDTAAPNKREQRQILRQVASRIEKLPPRKPSRLVTASQAIGRFQQQRFGVRSRKFRKGILPSTKDVYKLRGIATILGAPGSPGELRRMQAAGARRSRGRPTGSYKYGIPAEQYRAIQRQKQQVLNRLNQSKVTEYVNQGYSPEQAARAMQIKQQALMQAQANAYAEPQPRRSNPSQVVTPEDRFRALVDAQELSPNTVAMLDRLKEVQNKAQFDDFENQRRLKERRIVADAGNLLKARNLFGPDSAKFNIMETEGNILQAPNVFKEIPGNMLLRPTGRPTILNTREAGNSLFF